MLNKVFPFVQWFRSYSFADLRADCMAGLTVALVLIPQSMAYAQLAGLPPYYGLYASFLPPLIAALFGSSRQLATGPVAVVSLMTAACLEPIALTGSEGYIAYAITLSLAIGLFQLFLGVLRLGVVVNFLSHPVVIGFTNAAALIIATSQLARLFGVQVDKAEYHYQTIARVVGAVAIYAHLPTLFMGCGSLLLMLLARRYAPRFPSVLAVVVLTIFLSWAGGFEHNRLVTVEEIKSPVAREKVLAYSNQSGVLVTLMEKRTKANADLAFLSTGDPAWISARREIDLFSHRIRIAGNDVTNGRQQLRMMLFKRVVEGRYSGFYLESDLPPETKTDGRIWRLQVGSRALDTGKMTMAGGGAVVGRVPGGLPRLELPQLDIASLASLFSYAVIIGILGFMEAISIAKAMAAKTGQRLDPNQELIGQGLGNILGAMGQSYPTSGSFSRSAVNLQAGARTGMSSVFTSMTVVLTLLYFTPMLYHLPQSVLAAVIMIAVLGLINVKGVIHSWQAQWYDGVIAVITFCCTLFFAPHLDKGIFIGVILSLLVFLYKSMRPQVVSLSRGEDQYLHDALTHGLKECKYIDMIRFEGPLFFANASYLEDRIIDHIESKPKLHHIIIEASGISMMDASGEEALWLIVDRVRSGGMEISFCGVHQDVLDVMMRTGMIKKIGVQHLFANMEEALNAVYTKAHKDPGDILTCPLKTVIYSEDIDNTEQKDHRLINKLRPWKMLHR